MTEQKIAKNLVSNYEMLKEEERERKFNALYYERMIELKESWTQFQIIKQEILDVMEKLGKPLPPFFVKKKNGKKPSGRQLIYLEERLQHLKSEFWDYADFEKLHEIQKIMDEEICKGIIGLEPHDIRKDVVGPRTDEASEAIYMDFELARQKKLWCEIEYSIWKEINENEHC
ncbi:hypothetical protein P4644_16140 [Priestia aryabhattai]|uniref:hypothetical protein n=1 Tax=Priestia aryabhattai TaxID=412384 RepID=UPI002E2159D1|nr:hypothetical protein [Priestia aryabhattai]